MGSVVMVDSSGVHIWHSVVLESGRQSDQRAQGRGRVRRVNGYFDGTQTHARMLF